MGGALIYLCNPKVGACCLNYVRIFLKVRSEKKKKRERERKRCSIYWFIHQMATSARVGADQKLGNRSFFHVHGPKDLDYQQGAGVEVE